MRMRALTATASALLVATLGLTACGPEDSDQASDGKGSSASPADSGGKGKDSAGGSGGKESGSGGKDSGSGGGGIAPSDACTTKNTDVTFISSPTRATDVEPAKATVLVTNTSTAPCSIVGPTTLNAKDVQDKAGPVSTDNSAAGPDAVDVPAGKTVSAVVEYMDVNLDGTGEGRDVCAVQADEVEIALPKDEGRTVKVTKEGGETASFMVCDINHVKFGAFKA